MCVPNGNTGNERGKQLAGFMNEVAGHLVHDDSAGESAGAETKQNA